jgi:hypothetical protein
MVQFREPDRNKRVRRRCERGSCRNSMRGCGKVVEDEVLEAHHGSANFLEMAAARVSLEVRTVNF